MQTHPPELAGRQRQDEVAARHGHVRRLAGRAPPTAAAHRRPLRRVQGGSAELVVEAQRPAAGDAPVGQGAAGVDGPAAASAAAAAASTGAAAAASAAAAAAASTGAAAAASTVLFQLPLLLPLVLPLLLPLALPLLLPLALPLLLPLALPLLLPLAPPLLLPPLLASLSTPASVGPELEDELLLQAASPSAPATTSNHRPTREPLHVAAPSI